MTKVYLTQTGSFTASHSHGGTLAESLHEHTFTYEVTFYGPLNEEGFLLDFREVQKELSQIVKPLEKQNLSTLFKNPTTENICLWLYKKITKVLPHLYSVKLAEAPDRWILYKGEK
ncbi:MAG: 6-carboxytetrahydropterin synthase [Elusimicrobiaceae bacterium]|nr:6-carboxytetrahydropterin synthase [Elusimicrobiaceae bacterium]